MMETYPNFNILKRSWVMETIIYILVFIGGAITLIGAILNWESMYKNRRARIIVSSFGLTGARIFYGIIGLLLMGGALAGLLGIFN
jgi:hypothetical protein